MERFKKTNSLSDINEGRLILINKPIGWTSFQVVNKIRYILCRFFKIKKLKVGHAGTLDPLATGLLIIAIGKATKQIHKFQEMKKVYTGVFTLGSSTPSFDLETKPNKNFNYKHLNDNLIIDKTRDFIGEIDQKPPIYSALKKEGKRLYEYARKKEVIEIESRKVEIKEFTINSINLPDVNFKIKCGKGTYIRSLANDFGLALKSGAHLSKLERISIGNYKIENASKITDFEKLF
tara:strand:- start:4746 stop:5450 length:705 start_codon:yes stop_codon:yes gene_type:complete